MGIFKVVTRATGLISTRVHLLCYTCSSVNHLNAYAHKYFTESTLEISQTHTKNFFFLNNFDDLDNYLFFSVCGIPLISKHFSNIK